MVHKRLKIDELILKIFKVYLYICIYIERVRKFLFFRRFLQKIQDDNNFINYELQRLKNDLAIY